MDRNGYKGVVIYEDFCYKKINNVLFKIDTMSCTKFVNFIKIKINWIYFRMSY